MLFFLAHAFYIRQSPKCTIILNFNVSASPTSITEFSNILESLDIVTVDSVYTARARFVNYGEIRVQGTVH